MKAANLDWLLAHLMVIDTPQGQRPQMAEGVRQALFDLLARLESPCAELSAACDVLEGKVMMARTGKFRPVYPTPSIPVAGTANPPTDSGPGRPSA